MYSSQQIIFICFFHFSIPTRSRVMGLQSCKQFFRTPMYYVHAFIYIHDQKMLLFLYVVLKSECISNRTNACYIRHPSPENVFIYIPRLFKNVSKYLFIFGTKNAFIYTAPKMHLFIQHRKCIYLFATENTPK